MNNKYFFTAFLFAALSASSSFAAFEYNGTFSANRKPGEVQSYYILLNENTNINFSIKSGGKDCKEVFVNSIKLASDESVSFSSKTGITNYHIPTTGIYEVSVTSSAPSNVAISYDLTVNESVGSEVAKESQQQNTKPAPQEVKTVEKDVKTAEVEVKKPVEDTNTSSVTTSTNSSNFSLIGEARIIDDSEPELKNNPRNTFPEENSINSSLTENNEQDIKREVSTESKENIENLASATQSEKADTPIATENKSENNNLLVPVITQENINKEPVPETKEEKVTTAVAEPLNPDVPADEDDDYGELDPDAPAVEEEESEPIPEPVEPQKEISYKGSLKLVNSFDAFRFLGDKNKCWPKSICFDDKNNLWLLDGQLCHIICYSPKGTELVYFGKKGNERNELGIPVSLAVYKDYILVGDRQKKCIHIFNKKGVWINAIQNEPKSGLKISNPVAICIRGEEIWVGDGSTKRILCFDKNFSFLGSFGSTKDSKINSISYISTDNEFIYILEEDGVLKKFGTMGNFLSAVPTGSQFAVSLLVDNKKNFWITDLEQNKVYCLNADGKNLFSIDKKSLSGLFPDSDKFTPSSVSISSSAKIAIADTHSKQIMIFEIK